MRILAIVNAIYNPRKQLSFRRQFRRLIDNESTFACATAYAQSTSRPKVGTLRTASSLVCDVPFIPGRRDSMASSVLCLNDPIAQRGMAVFEELLRDFHPRNFAVRLWDRSRLDAEEGRLPRCTLVINHPGAIRRMFLPGNQAALGEAYAYGDVDIEGDMEVLFPLLPFLMK